jgi:hypothetical protein
LFCFKWIPWFARFLICILFNAQSIERLTVNYIFCCPNLVKRWGIFYITTEAEFMDLQFRWVFWT